MVQVEVKNKGAFDWVRLVKHEADCVILWAEFVDVQELFRKSEVHEVDGAKALTIHFTRGAIIIVRGLPFDVYTGTIITARSGVLMTFVNKEITEQGPFLWERGEDD